MRIFQSDSQPAKGEAAAYFRRALLVAGGIFCPAAFALGVDNPPLPAAAGAGTLAPPAPETAQGLFIREYRVLGATQMPRIEIEEAVYPYLGPARTTEDIEQARAALEKAYQDKGYQTVSVRIPVQQVNGGVVVLQVVEGRVGRVRVEGSRFFSLDTIKKKVPSLAPGTVPNFNDVKRDLVALNQWPDRRVTPELKAGAEPGTVDIDLKVKDTLPLHGSIELNNRYSVGTTPLRLNGAVSYNNLWQLGHTIGGSFQIAPERLSDAVVYSAYYIARIPNLEWLSLMAQGTRQNSNVSTLGGAAVAGNGEVYGGRALITLPSGENFYHSLNFGLDYKHFDQDLTAGDDVVASPITYYPFSVSYSAAWAGKGYATELNSSVVFCLRGMGNNQEEFDARRFNADGGFIYFRGDLAHTRDLPLGFQIVGRVQGQAANKPLVDSEQFAAGGLDTVRGYLEAAVLGDNAFIGSMELRTPSLVSWLGIGEWRFFGFVEGGMLNIYDALPEQQSYFTLASVGGGSRVRLFEHLNGAVNLGIPLVTQSTNVAGSLLMTFEIWADF